MQLGFVTSLPQRRFCIGCAGINLPALVWGVDKLTLHTCFAFVILARPLAPAALF